jgi:signal transduction histidine kinase
MIAGDLLRAHAQPWFTEDRRDALHVLAPIPVLAVSWWVYTLQLSVMSWVILLLYAVTSLFLVWGLNSQSAPPARRALLWSSALCDALFALTLLFVAGATSGVALVVGFLLVLKAVVYRRILAWFMLVPVVVAPVYLATLVVQLGVFAGWSSTTWFVASVLVLGSALLGVTTVALGVRSQREQRRLQQQIEAERAEYSARVAELNSAANDLRSHIRSQQALEESLRAVTGSLSLDDVLRQILDSTIHMLGGERVDGAALTLQQNGRSEHYLLTLDQTLPDCWADALSQQMGQEQRPILVNNAAADERWQALQQCGAVSALCVPLIGDDGQTRGVLSVVSRKEQAFSLAESRHLNAFGFQACVAIRNAELHSQLRSQWAMLEAVLRDLGDGLAVFDESGAVVLMNPVARRVLMSGGENSQTMQSHVGELVRDVQRSGGRMLWSELPGGDDGQFFQAIASRARVNDTDASHVAVVLHDITNQKANEKARSEFISMVSHELRNPLHTLGGFLRVVLQGRAGALTSLQHDFLQTAEEQVEKLNGRINELLEFNRLDNGRLRLERERSDLPLLASATSSALMLQAEQAGLSLFNDVPNDLPELEMDSKRIGQVLTNLIENAIKATPPSGTIRLTAWVEDTDVRVSVIDTGIGIPEADVRKIFDPFYGRSTQSMYGVHLGLGLSICQQIIEGHGGRIWVDSEEGRGSTFSFTLPLAAQEHELVA